MKILQVGNNYNLSDDVVVHDELPRGVYNMSFDPRKKSFYLIKEEDFVLPPKLYGDFSCIERWRRSFYSTNKNLGIALTGIKGSGKTLLAKKFCISMGLPVIMVSDPEDNLNEFISFLTSSALYNCIIFVDEYEKIFKEGYGNDEVFLSILDGPSNNHSIFILTMNDFDISPNMINRPSRIRYRENFESLPESIISEVVDDLLINKEHRESIPTLLGKIGIITYDLLVSLINEMNMLNQDAVECSKGMNLVSESKIYNVFEIFKGKEYSIDTSAEVDLVSNSSFNVYRRMPSDLLSEEDSEYKEYLNTVHRIPSISPDELTFRKPGVLEYIGKEGHFIFKEITSIIKTMY